MENFAVRLQRQYVEKYSQVESWTVLNDVSQEELKENVALLVISTDSDEYAKRFDAI